MLTEITVQKNSQAAWSLERLKAKDDMHVGRGTILMKIRIL